VRADRGWKRPFDEPIPVPRGRQLVTLQDAGTYITTLPKSEHTAPEWQAAMEALILVATLGGAGDVREDRLDAGFKPPRRARARIAIGDAGSWRGIDDAGFVTGGSAKMTDTLPANAVRLYCELMEEIKRRTEVIQNVIGAQIKVPIIVGLELCYLQLRMICELIALACLTVHGDVPATKAKRLTRAYNADQILKNLERLHPSFYPVPGRQILNFAGKPVEVVNVTEPHLNKKELQRLYGECR
jgi:hypothetical protein